MSDTTKMEIELPELLPCPFCGSCADLLATHDECWVECDSVDCDARTISKDTEAEAIAAWNKRTPPEQREELSDEWRSMIYAPMDGTEVELLVFHTNRQYAEEHHKENWEAIVRAKWIDFNGGGWTWNGMAGQPVGWRAIDAARKQTRDAEGP